MNNLFRKLVPKFIRGPFEKNKLKFTILNYYNSTDQEFIDEEKRDALNYLKDKGFSVFPNRFQEKYKRSDIEVHVDPSNQLKYIITDGKRLYFKRKSSKRGVRRNYNFLKIEQDKKSPHRYLTSKFKVEENDILVDVGAAEGNLPLEVIEKVKKVYLFETDERWIEALEATFAPWKDKVVIVNKFVSNVNDKKNVSLDVYFKDKEPYSFLKVDAEGAEGDILEGSQKTIANSDNLKIALCCYHKPHDEDKFKAHLEKRDFEVSFADGYMVFPEPKTFNPPYLRRGVLRAVK
ncbi:FkbM family methyltransferase [Marivirga salinae]|uniref:FkbM family methyltransferase n=1 Tax=Marivirga salinarum TaxID=3059078 RepID=A0AA51NB75_9BACT|nr:FkbM family methyltransferase [Marivirga sp. BDSF4-3]WMN11933.1 FkbM family methyltransferase [Marivirga sp. BDSF4-3]